MTLTDRQRSQMEATHALYLPPEVDEALVKYADDNAMSVSEAAREIMTDYLGEGPIPIERVRPTRRRMIWAAGDIWLRYRNKARADQATNAQIFRRALLGEDEDS